MINIGDVSVDQTIYIPFNTFNANGASVTVTDLVATDVKIYKDGGITERDNANGVTVSINHDGKTGKHLISIDLSNNTDAGFYASGSDYQVEVEGITVATQTINAWVGIFSIQNRFMRGTDSAALASVCTEGRLEKLDAGNIPADIDIIKNSVPSTFKKNTAFNNFEFEMFLTSDHVTGGTLLTVTAQRSIDGGAYGACANSVTEVSSGTYKINLAASDLNGDFITFKFTADTADATKIGIKTKT